MSIITIILFFIYTWGLGFAATMLLKNSENGLERNLMRIGIGLGIFPILAVFLNLVRIPLVWHIFFIISIAFPAYSVFLMFKNKSYPSFKLKLTKSDLTILAVLAIFFITFFMYEKGAFAYPYLEDDDPWTHAKGVKYITLEKTAFEPKGAPYDLFLYIDAYPPGYPILMAMLHQTSSSMMWTLKFFNALIISLSIIFFYFFAKEFIGNRNKALFATFALAAIPAYLSHFIWAVSLITTLFFPAFYCLERIKYDKRWWYAAALVIGGIMVVQPTHAFKFGIFFLIYWLVKALIERKFLLHTLLAGASGLLLSLFFWWIPMLVKYGGFLGLLKTMGPTELSANVKGSATRIYYLSDFIWAKTQNMINNPIGVGVVLFLLFVISVAFVLVKYNKGLFKKENSWITITLFWIVFTLIGLNGARLPFSLVAFRFWMLFAIPLSILVSEGMWFLMNLSEKIKISKIIVLAAVVIGILLTSGYQKYAVNTAMWGPGQGWSSNEELAGHMWLKTLPVNTKLFNFLDDDWTIGLDKYSCAWCNDVIEFRKGAINKPANELHSWMRNEGYEYTLLGEREARNFGINETIGKINEMLNSGLFRVAYQTNGVVIMKVA